MPFFKVRVVDITHWRLLIRQVHKPVMFFYFYCPWLTYLCWIDNILCWRLAIGRRLNLNFSLLMPYDKARIRVIMLKWLNPWCCCGHMLDIWCLIHIDQWYIYQCVFGVVRTRLGEIGEFRTCSIGRKMHKIAGRHKRGLTTLFQA